MVLPGLPNINIAIYNMDELIKVNIKQSHDDFISRDYKLITCQNPGKIIMKSETVHISSKEEFKTVLENIKLFNNENSENQLYQRLTIAD